MQRLNRRTFLQGASIAAAETFAGSKMHMLAAAHADLHFSLVRTIEEGREYRIDINERLRRNGRAPDSLKILPGIVPIVAESVSEARDKQALLEAPSLPTRRETLVTLIEFTLRGGGSEDEVLQ